MSNSQQPINNYEDMGDKIIKYLFQFFQYLFILSILMMNFLPSNFSIPGFDIIDISIIEKTISSSYLQIGLLITLIIGLLIHKIFSYLGMKPPTQNEITLLRVALIIVVFPFFIWGAYEIIQLISIDSIQKNNLVSSLVIAFVPLAMISIVIFPIIQLIDYTDKFRNQNRSGIIIMLSTMTINILINSFVFLAVGFFVSTQMYKIDSQKALSLVSSKIKHIRL